MNYNKGDKKMKSSIWWICQFDDGGYIGQDRTNGGFIRVQNLFDAYLAVECELDDSAEVLSKIDEGYRILKVKVTGEEKITILADNFFK